MKNTLDRFWLPISGSATSVGFKGIENVTSFEPELLNVLVPGSDVLFYFGIGVLGALGGLCVKIVWSFMKRWFPKLKHFDN